MLFRDEQEIGRQQILAMFEDDDDEINFNGFLPNFDKDPAFSFCYFLFSPIIAIYLTGNNTQIILF